jgi:hypothetical protein
LAVSDQITALMPLLAPIVEQLATIDGIAAMVLGGSDGAAPRDEHSGIDLALYYDATRPLAIEALNRAGADLDNRHLDCLLASEVSRPEVNGWPVDH